MKVLSASIFKVVAILTFFTGACNIDEKGEPPRLESLQQGIKVSSAIGYCASIVVAAHKGLPLPANVSRNQAPGLLNVRIDDQFPLPFNKGNGNITIASLWNENGGIMSILFTGGNAGIYGFFAVPVAEDTPGGPLKAVYADQDIIVGNGSDTILDLSSITSFFLNSRLERLENPATDDPFVAVKQNFWLLRIKMNGTADNVYDDEITINGGGQIAEVSDGSGGVIYHAMIDTRLNYQLCSRNPVSGYALSQNFKAGGESLIDLGNSLITFHSTCDGKAHVDLSTGKYLEYCNRDIRLGFD
ncbi:MAG TPA: hypothetical protein VK155_14800 [Bacteroidales bacterium]|nr:hypothetical protein [Bacteroidales bacterium]